MKLICPKCLKDNDANLSVKDKAYKLPGFGDISVCAYCGHPAVLNMEGAWETMPEEFLELLEEDIKEQIRIAQAFITKQAKKN